MPSKPSTIANRGAAQAFLVKGLRLGLTTDEIIAQVTAAGLGYAPSTMARDLTRLRASPLPRQVPFGALTSLTSFTGKPLRLLGKGPQRYQYRFFARTRNELGQFNGGYVTWSFTSQSLLIPDIANGIGISIAPTAEDLSQNYQAPEGTVDISTNDIETLDTPYEIGSGVGFD